MKDSNREAFESWATDKFPIAGLGQFEKHNNGTYIQRSIRNMYEAWQAAKAQANQVWRTKCDELQARIDSLTNINESLVAYKNQLLDEIEEKGNKDEN